MALRRLPIHLAPVPNGTESLRRLNHYGGMPRTRAIKGLGHGTLARVKKELAKSRVAKSAREKYSNLGTIAPMGKVRKGSGHGEIKAPMKRGL